MVRLDLVDLVTKLLRQQRIMCDNYNLERLIRIQRRDGQCLIKAVS